MTLSKSYTAALIVIGNEILSGRTREKNINYIAIKMVERGIRLVEVRVIPDKEDVIISAVRALKDEADYLFTTGGIGPTHDDITALSIAKALGVSLVKDEQAYEILEAHYGGFKNFTEPRQKMAYVPDGSVLIPNPVSKAPGFVCENVYVLAGVPRIMQAMMEHVVLMIQGGDVVRSQTVVCPYIESVIAQGLSVIQERYEAKGVEIGSYPYFKENSFGTNIVLRSSNSAVMAQCVKEVEGLVSLS